MREQFNMIKLYLPRAILAQGKYFAFNSTLPPPPLPFSLIVEIRWMLLQTQTLLIGNTFLQADSREKFQTTLVPVSFWREYFVKVLKEDRGSINFIKKILLDNYTYRDGTRKYFQIR